MKAMMYPKILFSMLKKYIPIISYVFIQDIGKYTVSSTHALGKFTRFILTTIAHCIVPPMYKKEFLLQLINIFFFSITLISLTAFFAGAVLTLQSYLGFSRFNAEDSIATIIVISITREIGPVLTALMMSGRVGAGIASEIGNMRASEQIDALHTLSVHPIKYLAVPRILATLIALPLLTIIADVLGIFSSYIVGVYELGFNSGAYLSSTMQNLLLSDIVSGIIKSIFFGLSISSISVYYGYHCEHSSAAVGQATNQAVITASIVVLILNYLITYIML